MKLDKIIHQVWVGPEPAPKKWLDSWRQKHPLWEYKLWGNSEMSFYPWRNKKHIDYCRKEKDWRCVADVMRYEILSQYGGFMPGADFECINPIDDLFKEYCENYTIDTSRLRGKSGRRVFAGNTTPLIACQRKSAFALSLVKEMRVQEPPFVFANTFIKRMIKKYKPDITIWPQHYFIPVCSDGTRYSGKDKIYSRHYFGGRSYAIKKYSEGS
jgi:hypothetical protein